MRLAPSVLILLLSACTPAQPRGILLISVDTLRSDALETYGSIRPTSPFLLQLSRSGAVFENAFCPLPGTLPSHMSMLTGLYPEEHRVFPPEGILDPKIPLLAEHLRAAGFRTFGSTEGGYVKRGFGFSRGFESFTDEARHKENDVETSLDRTLDFLRSVRPGERFFAFLHTYVVHDPYFPPEPYASQFWDGPAIDGLPQLTGPNLVEINRADRRLTRLERSYLRARYDAQVRYLDDQLRDFFTELRDLGLLDDSIVVITSDHGEEFQEHGKLLHSQIYRECLQVPLIILDPRLRQGRRIASIAELVDLVPTLLDLAGLPGAQGVSGESLASRILEGDAESQGSGTAYSISESLHARSLIARLDGTTYQLLRFAPFVTDGHVYFAESFRFDHLEPTLRLGVASLGRPRTLSIRADDLPTHHVRIGFGSHGSFLDVQLDPARFKHEVVLAGGGCRDESGEIVSGCFLFQLIDSGFRRYELYDLARDPFELRDLSALDRRLFSTLRADLEGIALTPRGEPGHLDDPELRERLRALGYLQ